MKRVLDVFPEYVLEIYGKGEQQEELEKYAKELNISDNVKFMGQKANVQTYIVNASVLYHHQILRECLIQCWKLWR